MSHYRVLFEEAIIGKVLTTANLFNFFGVFIIQWFTGVIIFNLNEKYGFLGLVDTGFTDSRANRRLSKLETLEHLITTILLAVMGKTDEVLLFKLACIGEKGCKCSFRSAGSRTCLLYTSDAADE